MNSWNRWKTRPMMQNLNHFIKRKRKVVEKIFALLHKSGLSIESAYFIDLCAVKIW